MFETDADDAVREVPNERLRKLLTSRGPDHQAHHVIQLEIHSQSYFLIFYATILHLRGAADDVYKQPLVSHVTGNVLLFNGEVFHLSQEEEDERREEEEQERPHNHHHYRPSNSNDTSHSPGRDCLQTQNDTRLLFERLESQEDSNDRKAFLLNVISQIKGPFSMIYYLHKHQQLWIGKDCLGRRSLCFHKTSSQDPSFTISSVCDPDLTDGEWCEFPPNGFYCMQLNQMEGMDGEKSLLPICLHAWDRSPASDDADEHDLPLQQPHHRIKDFMQSPITCSLNKVIHDKQQQGYTSTCADGGLVCQSLVQQASSDLLQQQSDHLVVKNNEIASVASAVASVITDAAEAEVAGDAAVKQLEQVLDQSVKRRIQYYHQLCDQCCRSRSRSTSHSNDVTVHGHEAEANGESMARNENSTNETMMRMEKDMRMMMRQTCDHASVGVLFSGGIDCTVIALIADRYVPSHQPIDLINVSFAADSPDRRSCLSAHRELSSLRPDRIFNLVHADVEKQELISLRQNVIRSLIYPSDSVLDDSTGCAFFFAARGEGYLLDRITGEKIPYRSPARILLNGLGSDEQMAGYSRHRRIFHANGFDALNQEICREVNQLHRRNLGRDDRIISHHGKEVRYPFLDEDVVSFLNSLPIQSKCDLTLDRGIGEKKLLRDLALGLGLKDTAWREKRAIQFGSRIAKLEDRKEKGNMRCDRLLMPSTSTSSDFTSC